MSDSVISARVVGDAEIRQEFLDFGSDVRSRLRRELADAGQEIAGLAAAGAPHRSGELAGTITPRLIESNLKMMETIAPRGKYGSLVGRLMEFGVVNHGTAHNANVAGDKTKGGKRARARRTSELRAAGQWRIEPRPFMQPAYESLRDRIEAGIEAAIEGAVQAAGR